MNDINSEIEAKIEASLHQIEINGDIVITTTVLKEAAELIRKEVSDVYVGKYFTPREIRFFSQLAYEASNNKTMFNQELQCLTGYSEKEAAELGKKLSDLTSYW